jgi:S1-C subfamily serine protease
MSAGKLVVSTEEISQIQESAKDVADQGPPGARPLMSPIPWWGRIALSLLVLFLPLLCLIAIILRVAFRNAAPRLRYAWTSFLSTLLIISGFLTTASAIVIIFAVPVPVIVGSSLPDFDDRSDFPQLPVKADLNSSEASRDLKPLVIVVSPAMRMWRSQESASGMIGAGVLLYSDQNGYLFATARHMIAHGGWNFGGASAHEMIAGNSGAWAKADIVATAKQADLALLWIARQAGEAEFVQPIAAPRDGENIFVIGHPEDLRFSLSTGIVSGLRGQTVQVSAPISPGNSGGPVYDDRGNLIGIVSSKFDDQRDPNAENLGFAASAQMLLNPSAWSFHENGRRLLQTYIQKADPGNQAAANSN